MTGKILDRTGMVYSQLTVLEYVYTRNHVAFWLCSCECGNQIIVDGHQLGRGMRKSCGCMRGSFKDETGNRYGILTVISEYVDPDRPHGAGVGIRWLCQCDCGNQIVIEGRELRRSRGINQYTSCGCLTRSQLTDEERGRQLPEYYAWRHAVLERDGYICRACSSTLQPVAHHMLPYAMYPDRRTDVHNGITLCADCHREFHSIHGYKVTDKQTTLEFIGEKHA